MFQSFTADDISACVNNLARGRHSDTEEICVCSSCSGCNQVDSVRKIFQT